MRVTPVILIAIGIWGLIYPETLLELDAMQGRLVFCIILALGAFGLWQLKKRKS